jgi:hypothetical protein
MATRHSAYLSRYYLPDPRRAVLSFTFATLLLSSASAQQSTGGGTLAGSPPTQSPGSQSDEAATSNAERITFAQANIRIHFDNDIKLENALLESRNAKDADDVSNIFQSAAADDPDELDQATLISLYQTGLKVLTPTPTSDLASGATWLTNNGKGADNKVAINAIPPSYASVILLGAVESASAVNKEAIARTAASYLQRNFDDTLNEVKQNHIIEDPATGLSGTQYIDRQLYEEQTTKINTSLQNVSDLLSNNKPLQNTDTDQGAAKRQLDSDKAHYQAAVDLTGLILNPIVGPDATHKITTVGDNLIKIDTAVRQFGPQGIGISPDDLLMFTNVATATVAIVGLIASSQQKDPTMVALQGIMSQLQSIKKQLNEIENKIDDLTNLVGSGFEQVLTSISDLDNEFLAFQDQVLGQFSDMNQRKLVKAYLTYVNSDPENYQLAQKCDEITPTVDDQTCLNMFAALIADYTMFTGDTPRTPELSAPKWSNQLLSFNAIKSDADYSLVLQQLSFPIYLANDPKALLSMIAYNQSATAAYATIAMGAPAFANLANPEVLQTALQDLVGSLELRPTMRSAGGKEVVEQGIKRVDDIEAMLTATIGNAQAMQALWNSMAGDLQTYQGKVVSVFNNLETSPYTDSISKFNGGKAGTIPPCPSMGSGWPQLQAPYDPVSKGTMARFVEPLFWAAEEMHLGEVGQCYNISNKPAVRDPANGGSAYQIIGTINIFFNPIPQLSPTQLFSWEASPASTTYSNSSLPIATVSYTTNRHFSLYFGATIPVFSRAWGSPPANVHDVMECEVKGGFRYSYNPSCKAGPDADSPVHALVNAANQNPQGEQKTKAAIEGSVGNSLISVVNYRSPVWDVATLSFPAGTDPKILEDREVMTEPGMLADPLKQYTLKYLFAENLFLLGMYHQNPTSACLRALNDYSPQAVVTRAGKIIMGGDSISSDFLLAMSGVQSQCLGHLVNPDLSDLEGKLRGFQ